MRFLAGHPFTGEYLSRFRVQSDDMRGTPENGPLYHGQPAFCVRKQGDNPCLFKDHHRVSAPEIVM